MMWTYLLINFFAVIIPVIFSFHPKLNFYKNWKYFFQANLIISAIFIAWDILFTYWGIWGFNPKYLTGFSIINLPLEEVLFFICIPFSCVFTYHCFQVLFKFNANKKMIDLIVLPLFFILIFIGIINIDKIYTSTTFISLSMVLLFIRFFHQSKWLGNFFFTYLILLLPFFIINGILTGSLLAEHVVWYDNSENLGIRLFTIPVEDVFYGMELILFNVFLYEKLKSSELKIETV